MNGTAIFLLLSVLSSCLIGSKGEECVASRQTVWGTAYTAINCGSGCCGYWPDQYCCTPIEGIIGGIIGLLIFMGAVAAVILLIKKHQKSRVVVMPGHVVSQNTVVMTQ